METAIVYFQLKIKKDSDRPSLFESGWTELQRFTCRIIFLSEMFKIIKFVDPKSSFSLLSMKFHNFS